MNLDQCLALLRGSDRDVNVAVRCLQEELGKQMLRYFVRSGLSPSDAKDVLQETLINIVRGAKTYTAEGTAKAWVWTIARNSLYTFSRKSSKQIRREMNFDDSEWQNIADETPDDRNDASGGTVEECVNQRLSAFSEKHPDRAYVLTLHMEQRSAEAIGEIIGRTPAAVRQYLYECRAKVKALLQPCFELLKTGNP
jgi:RNA polymerase sigma factor (sigma-70 family)